MSQKNFDTLMALSGYGTPEQNAALERYSNPGVVSAKKASVEEASNMKALLYGGPEQLRTAVTAYDKGNTYADSTYIQDAMNMDPFAFLQKYGVEAAKERRNIQNEYLKLKQDQNRYRTVEEKAIDTGWQGLDSVNQLIGTGAVFATQGYDALGKGIEASIDAVAPSKDFYNYTPMAPSVAAGFAKLGEENTKLQSNTMQEDNKQYALEGALDAQDRALAKGLRDAKAGGSTVTSWLQDKGQEALDTLENLKDHPMQQTKLGVNAVASVLPFAKGINALGKATAMSALTKRGMSEVAARDFLKTAAGKEFLNKSSMQAVPVVSSVVSAGSAINDAQVAILGMSPETLHSLPEYAEMSAQGLSDEEIKTELAHKAGNVAGLSGALIGYVTGFMNRGFDAAPITSSLKAGGANKLKAAAKDVVQETVQETLEEGLGNKLSANLGLASVNPNQDIAEGVVESGVLGGVGGAISAGGMKTPSVALGTTQVAGGLALDAAKPVAKGVVNQAAKAADKRAAKTDQASPVGLAATQEAVNTIAEAANEISISAAAAEAPEANTPDKTKAAYAELTALFADAALTVDEKGQSTSIPEFFKNLDASQGTAEVTQENAVELVEKAARLSTLSSDIVQEKMQALDENDSLRQAYNAILESLPTIEGSTVLAKAREVIADMSQEDVANRVDLKKLSDENTSEEEKAQIKLTAIAISRINSAALSSEDYDTVFSHMSPEDAKTAAGKRDVAALTAARDSAKVSETSQAQKDQNTATFKKLVQSLPKNQQEDAVGKRVKSSMDVSIDIKERGFTERGKASLAQYTSQVNSLISEGKFNRARDLLAQLKAFAQSQNNKVNALNEAVAAGADGKQKFPYMAFNGKKEFLQEDTPVYVNKKSANSLVLALDIHADTQEVVGTYEALRKAYPDVFANAEPIEVSNLDGQIDNFLEAFPETVQKLEAPQQQQAPEAQDTQDVQEPQGAQDTQDTQVVEDTASTTETADTVTEEAYDAQATEQTTEQTTDQVVDQTVDQQTNAEAKPALKRKSVVERLTHLFDGENNNIVKHFTRRDAGSDLLDFTNLQKDLAKRIQDSDMSKSGKKALVSVLTNVLPKLRQDLYNELTLTASQEKSLRAKPERKNAKNLRVTELFSEDPKTGKLRLDPVVADATIMATLEWLVQLDGKPFKPLKRSEMRSLFGNLPPEAPITEQIKAAARFGGTHRQAALQDLSQAIQKMLGVQANKDADPAIAQGIFGGLALNMMQALERNNTIEVASFQTSDGSGNSVNRFAVRSASQNDTVTTLRKVISRLNNPLSRLVTGTEEEVLYHIGTAPKNTQFSTRWNKFTTLTAKMRKSLEKQNQLAYHLNTPLVAVVDSLGMDTLLELLGYQDLEKVVLHKEIASSQEGKNVTLLSSKKTVEGIRAAIEEYADSAEGSLALEDVPLFFANTVSSNGRTMQTSNSGTLQSDKVLRELLMPQTTDVLLESEKQMSAYWSGLAQALDIVSIEKVPGFASIKQDVMEALEAYQPAIDLLKVHLRKGSLPKKDAAKLKTQLKKHPFTMKVLHALTAEAQRQNAIEDGQNSFQTQLTIEADGKTDGPINAVMNLLAPKTVSATLVQVMAAGGLFFGNTKQTLDSYYQTGADLYGLVADKLQSKLTQRIQDAADFSKEALRMSMSMELAEAFLEGVETSDKDGLIISRQLVKNPITIFLYNSSKRGIASNIAEDTAKSVYALLSEIMQTQKRQQERKHKNTPKLRNTKVYRENHEALRSYMRFAEPTKYYGKRISVAEVEAFYADPGNLSVDEMRLTDLYLDTFVEPLTEAIDAVLPGLSKNMQLLQDVAEAHTQLFQQTFEVELENIRQADAENGYTAAELEQAFVAAMKVAPVYYTDTQSLHITNLEAAPSYNELAAPLNSSDKRYYRFFETTKEVGDSGKRMVPNFTISTGDGSMVAGIYANDENGVMDYSVQVFDGIEMSIGSFMDGSKHINEQVFNNWTSTNVFTEVARSIEQALAQAPNEIAATTQDAQEALKAHLKTVKELAAQADTFNETLKTFPSSTDHMAGAKEAHFNEGTQSLEGISSNNFDALSRVLDKTYQANQSTKQSKDSAVVEQMSKPLKKALSFITKPVEGFKDIQQVSGAELIALFKKNSAFTPDQKKVFWDILANDPMLEDHTFYFGSQKALEAFRDENFEDVPKTPISLGQTFLHENIVLVANMSGETLLHEMLHAGLAKRLVALENAPETFSPEVRIAYNNLKKLGRDFLSMKLTEESGATQEEIQAFKAMQDQMKGLNKPEHKLSEFLSWAMANKHMIDRAKKTKVHGPIVKLLMKGLREIKKLLGLKSPGLDMFSNITFNASVLVRGTLENVEEVTDTETETVLEHAYGTDTDLTRIEKLFLKRVNLYIEAGKQQLDKSAGAMDKQAREKRVLGLQAEAASYLEHLASQGASLSLRQANTFAAVYASLQTAFKIDSFVMQQATEAYRTVLQKLTPEHFVKNWATARDEEKAAATAKHAYLTDSTQQPGATAGRVAQLIALAQVDPSTREALSKISADPQVQEASGPLVSRTLKQVVNAAINLLGRMFGNVRQNANTVNDQLRILAEALAEIKVERDGIATKLVHGTVDKIDNKTSSLLQTTAGAVSDKAAQAAKAFDGKTKPLSLALNAAAAATGMLNTDKARETSEAVTKALNKTSYFSWLSDIVRDLNTDSDSMTTLGMMLNKVRDLSDRIRQHEKDDRIKNLNDAFTKKLTKAQHKDLYMGLGRTDISSLGRQTVLELIQDPSKATQMLQQFRQELKELAPKQFASYNDKISSLVNHMLTWKVDTPNLLRNAHAIAHLFNEKGEIPADQEIDPQIIVLISKLISLEAFSKLEAPTKETLMQLSKTEPKAMKLLVGNLAEAHQKEFKRRPEDKTAKVALHNGWKGYLPLNFDQGKEVIIADDRDQAELESRGYVRIKDYVGDARETYSGRRGVYQTTVGGKGQFRQGILQTVHTHWHGVDVRYGNTVTSQTATGLITGPEAQRIAKTQSKQAKDGNYLLPLLDDNGKIYAYERSLPMTDVQASNPNFDLTDALGSWFGRIAEESVATDLNAEIIKRVKDVYDQADAGDMGEFVNIADPNVKDPVYKDAWNTLGWESKQNAAKVFGRKDFFPVKRNEIDVIMGYRSANVKDIWTGVSRMDDKTRKIIQDVVSLPFGKNTFKYLSKADGVLMQAVSWAKTTIVVRSGIVPVANMAANVMHLAILGVPYAMQAKKTPQKLREIHRVVKIQQEIGRLKTLLPAVIGNAARINEIEQRIAALEEEQQYMSIWPVLANHEFSTISEGLTKADMALRNGNLFDWFEAQVDKLPKGTADVAKNVLMTKDSTTFSYMHHFMQYGDFVAKSILYDHLVESKGLDPEQALRQVSTEFVNYNLPEGRWRGGLESHGLVWFSNYALRIMPIFMRTLRERPASMLLYGGVINPAIDVDSVMSGSVLGKAWRGTLGYSIGPGMGLRSYGLNPILNMILP